VPGRAAIYVSSCVLTLGRLVSGIGPKRATSRLPTSTSCIKPSKSIYTNSPAAPTSYFLYSNFGDTRSTANVTARHKVHSLGLNLSVLEPPHMSSRYSPNLRRPQRYYSSGISFEPVGAPKKDLWIPHRWEYVWARVDILSFRLLVYLWLRCRLWKPS
jgi:hypothetical protein